MKYLNILVISIWVTTSCGRQHGNTTRNAEEHPSPSSTPSENLPDGSNPGASSPDKNNPCSLYANPAVLKRGETTRLSFMLAEVLPPKTSDPVRNPGASITTSLSNQRRITLELGNTGVSLSIEGNPSVYRVGPNASTRFRMIVVSPTEACEATADVTVN